MSLAEKLRKAREKVVEAGGFKFTVRRPTDLEFMRARGPEYTRNAIGWVVGWEGVTTLSMGLPGGDGNPVAYDPALAVEWLSDRADLLAAIIEDAQARYEAHAEALKAAAKN